MKPTFSCLCVTFGRVRWLSEAVACYLAQDYDGESELVILNTCPQQTLSFEHPKVRVENCATRPKSLGDARNKAVSLSRFDHIVNFDDDDLCLPTMLSNYAKAFSENKVDWIRLNPTFYSEAFTIRGVFSTWINSVSFTRSAYNKVGGYSTELSVGEDRNLFSRLSSECVGVTIETGERSPWVYSWNNGTYHASGHGDDKPGELTAWERCRIDLERRIQSGKEPVGVIKLVPKLEHDPIKMVDDWLQKQTKPQTNKPPICLVQLGRFGDIINMLPIAYHIAAQYDRPHFLVSKEFASILDGCSYVIPDVVDLRNDQINEALAIANRKYPFVINTQIWGTNFHPERHATAYNLESWQSAGFGHKFKDTDWYPVFDRRDHQKEEALAHKLLGHCTKPVLLVNVTHAHSAPFPEGPQVLQQIKELYSERYDIVDIGPLRFDRIYELLTAIERSSCVISIDTALLHLTCATNTPLLALINPNPWVGSIPRTEHCLTVMYDLAPQFLNGPKPLPPIASLHTGNQRIAHEPPMSPPERRIFHALERHTETDEKSRWRKNIAEKSWEKLYTERGVIPCHYRDYKRNAKDAIGDPRALPYLKDVLEFGMAEAGPNDIIMWTNDDNYLHPGVVDMVQFHCSLWGVVSAQRCEFMDCAIPVGPVTPQILVSRSRSHMGRDLFAFTKQWLTAHWEEIPDLILGASDFDLMLACMIRLQWGIETTRLNLIDTIWPAEMPRGYVAHQYHVPRWRDSVHVNSDPSQLHNRTLFFEWAKKHLPSLKFHAHLTI